MIFHIALPFLQTLLNIMATENGREVLFEHLRYLIS